MAIFTAAAKKEISEIISLAIKEALADMTLPTAPSTGEKHTKSPAPDKSSTAPKKSSKPKSAAEKKKEDEVVTKQAVEAAFETEDQEVDLDEIDATGDGMDSLIEDDDVLGEPVIKDATYEDCHNIAKKLAAAPDGEKHKAVMSRMVRSDRVNLGKFSDLKEASQDRVNAMYEMLSDYAVSRTASV
jgi:pyruvate/2-oxoglutarate dehydrogenase complex dihydrolipoamide acyltransferase (E2) component